MLTQDSLIGAALVEYASDGLSIELCYVGDGKHGPYKPENAGDQPLLRLFVTRYSGRLTPPLLRSGQLTALSIDDAPTTLTAAAHRIHTILQRALAHGRPCEQAAYRLEFFTARDALASQDSELLAA